MKNALKELNKLFNKIRYTYTDNQLSLFRNLAEKLLYEIYIEQATRKTQEKLRQIQTASVFSGGISLCLTCEHFEISEDVIIDPESCNLFDDKCLKNCTPKKLSKIGVVLCNNYKGLR